MTKKQPQDSTLRNVRAAHRRIKVLTKRLARLEHVVRRWKKRR